MLGIVSVMRTEAGFAIGEQNIHKFKDIKNKYLINGFIVMLIYGIFVFTFSY